MVRRWISIDFLPLDHFWSCSFIGGASRDPCDDTYCGGKAFSEVETAQVAKFIGDHNDTIVHYINFHSYSQLWMSPWGTEFERAIEFFRSSSRFFSSRLYYEETGSVQITRWWISPSGGRFGRSLRFVVREQKTCVSQQCDLCSGTRYEHGNIGATIYVASGNTVDWTSGTANVTFSYAVELRDTGKNDEVFSKKLSFPS